MGSIQRQSIRSTIGITLGFAIGAFNMLVLAPKILTTEQLGLTRLITDLGITLATLCTFGTLPVVYKFFPFYRDYLPPKKNDLSFITFSVCTVGFLVVCTAGYFSRHLTVQKFSSKSPLFVSYSYLVYPFCLFYLAYMWLEAFGWSFKKGVTTSLMRELIPRVIFTILLLLFLAHLIELPLFLLLFAISYAIPAFSLLAVLRKEASFKLTFSISKLTQRLKGKMLNFGLFLFGAQFLNLVSRTADTVIISSKSEKGLADAALFTLATYVVTLMEIPQRSITAITIPVLSDAWKDKNLGSISSIYKKSVANLLIIGLAMFGLMLLNVHNLGIFLGKDYEGIEKVVFFLGISKMIDLGTGANTQIISTSSFWRTDFFTNVIYTLIALPLNYFLIAHFQVMGAAYSTLIAIGFYNAMRFGFLWYKFGFQPYTWKDLMAVGFAAAGGWLAWLLPQAQNIFADTALRTILFSIVFFPLVYAAKVSEEVNGLIKKYIISAKDIIFPRR